MCGGKVGKVVKKVTNVATLGLTDDPIEAVTLGGAKTTKGGGLAVAGKDIIPGVPQLPDIPIPADPEAIKAEAASKVAAEELQKRRRVAAGGRQSTLLAGADVAAKAQQRKTLLGQ